MIENADFISQVGFPIAMVVYLLYERNRTTNKLIGEIRDNNKELIQAFNELRVTLIGLKEKLYNNK